MKYIFSLIVLIAISVSAKGQDPSCDGYKMSEQIQHCWVDKIVWNYETDTALTFYYYKDDEAYDFYFIKSGGKMQGLHYRGTKTKCRIADIKASYMPELLQLFNRCNSLSSKLRENSKNPKPVEWPVGVTPDSLARYFKQIDLCKGNAMLSFKTTWVINVIPWMETNVFRSLDAEQDKLFLDLIAFAKKIKKDK